MCGEGMHEDMKIVVRMMLTVEILHRLGI